MIDYRELRTKLDNSPPDQWDQIVEDAIEIYESKVNELPGEVTGSAVSDVETEDGPYQDGDGESYDQEELEYHFFLSITPHTT